MQRLPLLIRYLILLWFASIITGTVMYAQNVVVRENRKRGTTDWILNKVRADTCRLIKPYKADLFCRQQDIEGYCSKTSVKAGES